MKESYFACLDDGSSKQDINQLALIGFTSPRVVSAFIKETQRQELDIIYLFSLVGNNQLLSVFGRFSVLRLGTRNGKFLTVVKSNVAKLMSEPCCRR